MQSNFMMYFVTDIARIGINAGESANLSVFSHLAAHVQPIFRSRFNNIISLPNRSK